MNFKWGLTLFLYAIISFKYLEKVVSFRRMVNENFDDHDDIDQEGEGEEVRTDLEQQETEARVEPLLTNGHQVEKT